MDEVEDARRTYYAALEAKLAQAGATQPCPRCGGTVLHCRGVQLLLRMPTIIMECATCGWLAVHRDRREEG